MRTSDEALLTLTKPIANWQAVFAWRCAEWGLIPLLGLPLGLLGLMFGVLGWFRVRRQPDDLGIRHAWGGLILGAVELGVHIVGLAFISRGLLEVM